MFAKGRWRVFALAAIAPIAALASLEDALRDISVFSEALAVLRRAGARKAAYEAYLKAMDVEETPMSTAAVWAEMELLGNRLYFDRDGQLHLDDRFVLPEEHKTLYKAEEVFRRMCEGGIAGIPPGVKISQISKPGAAQTSSGGKGALPQLSKRAAETKPDVVPVFRGFEDARYQEHDSLILKCVAEFNRDRAAWTGATPEQACGVYDITPALVKAHMIEESGGNGARSLAAWKVDPEQVNVPGDWSPAKALLGLNEPSRRNEGTAELNVQAAIKFLSRKGFGVSGQPAAKRPGGTFDGWLVALQRYNGRTDETMDGRAYRDAYADRITRRALDPSSFVPISTPLKNKRKGVR